MKTIQTKLLVSVLALCAAITLATTTTFAWFSMNSKVDVMNLSMNVTTQGDLLISNAEDGTYDTSVNFAPFTDKYLSPVTIKKASESAVLGANGALGFQSLEADTEVKDSYYQMDLYFKSVSQYDVYIDTVKLAAALKTFTDPAAGIVTMEKAVNALYPYYVKDGVLHKVTDVVVDANGKFISAKIDDTVKNVVESGTDTKVYTLEDAGVTMTFSLNAEKEVEIAFTGADRVINTDEKIDADAMNALRIGVVNHNPATPVLTVVDPRAKEGYSAYSGLNMAHDYYDAVAAITGGKLDDKFKTEAVAPAADFTSSLLTLKAGTPITSDGETINVYTGHITIYMWLEGADADCLASIANSIISGSLSFRGVYIQK